MTERVLLGHVAVESGRLVVADPSRLDGQWLRETDLHKLHVWGPDATRLAEAMRSASGIADAFRQEPDHWILTPALGQLVETLHERAELLSAETGWQVRFSYPYRTSSEVAAEHDQLDFLEGGTGLAVAGTAPVGLFPVYAVLEAGIPVRLEVTFNER